MFVRSVAILLFFFGSLSSAFGQPSAASVVIDSDLRVFTTIAALNVAGFDVELGSQYHPVRAAVRNYVSELDPDLVRRLRQFYASRKGDQPDDTQLAQYISLAVMLTDPPELRPAFREELLPPDARNVLGFADLLREFYQNARISQRWTQLRIQYDREIDRLGPQIRDMILLTDSYLRVPLGGPSARNMFIYPELTAPLNSVNVRSNQDNYYVVVGGSTTSRLDEIRHAYLHFHLDNLVGSRASKIVNRNTLLLLAANQPGVQREYTTDFNLMVTESLIRALEIRMDRIPAARAEESVRSDYRSGLLLVPHFYQALLEYEKRGSGIRDELALMTDTIDLGTERERFEKTFQQIPIPARPVSRAEVPVPPPNDPVRDLLKEAEAAFNGGDNERARTSFETVLGTHDANNGAALYGLGLIASREGNGESAGMYFERAVASDSAEPGMKVWAYIFLGRIRDLDCERTNAVEYYRKALQIGDNTRNALAAAQEGISTPWGDVCR